MKKVLLCVGAAVMASSCAWSLGWGLLNFPSYGNSAKEACSKFDSSSNGTLEYIFDMQPELPRSSQTDSMFKTQLCAWDAKADWKTSRGTLQAIWGRAGESDPANGWPVISKGPTFEELSEIYRAMPD